MGVQVSSVFCFHVHYKIGVVASQNSQTLHGSILVIFTEQQDSAKTCKVCLLQPLFVGMSLKQKKSLRFTDSAET